jgi:Acyltransferase
MKKDFHPPRENPFCLFMLRVVRPLLSRIWRGVESVTIAPDEVERLRVLGQSRLLLCANHPTLGDPLVIFELGRQAGITFNYMAAHELFVFPLGGILQRLGAYSVQRGGADREAIRMTQRLLAEQNRQVVIFPEGLTHGHNDLLLPLHGGPVQIGFRVLEDLEKRGEPLHLPIVPIAIKYCFVGDAEAAIRASLTALERATGLKLPAGSDLYGRLRTVGEHVLGRMEREFCLCPATETPLAERIAAAKAHVVERVAAAIDVRLPAVDSVAAQLHFLDNALAAFRADPAAGSTPTAPRPARRRRRLVRPLERDLRRLHNFIAVSDGYVASGLTAERFLEVLGRLEVEVFGKSRRRGHFGVIVRVGEPLQLSEYLPVYRQNKRAAITEVSGRLAHRMRELLHPLSALGTPVITEMPVDGWEESVGVDGIATVGGPGTAWRPNPGHSLRHAVEQEPA